jgi:hypothetical protein
MAALWHIPCFYGTDKETAAKGCRPFGIDWADDGPVERRIRVMLELLIADKDPQADGQFAD